MTFRSTWTPPPKMRDLPPPAPGTTKPLVRGTYMHSMDALAARPKSPSTRSQDLRDLAQGEQCTVCGGAKCAPDTTVWAHANGLADNKGRGYKSHDHLGFFAGSVCHTWIDQGDGPERDKAVVLAQHRTRERLQEIAGNIALKPWRVEAARWALQQLESRKP